jgi:MFS transporter, DHA3 family, macrolide efflux protein
MGLRPILLLVTLGAFIAHFTLAFVSSINDTLWQEKTPSEALGRVLSLRQTVMRAATLIAYLLAGGLLDRWIEPLLLPGSTLSNTLGGLFGVGHGRGIALFCTLIGLVKIVTVLVLSAPARKSMRTEQG